MPKHRITTPQFEVGVSPYAKIPAILDHEANEYMPYDGDAAALLNVAVQLTSGSIPRDIFGWMPMPSWMVES